ncbi:bifunctional adenosylcobinamide kinase/adenosylcobinamide-phosphate guanylyltransferase [Chitinilyticum litopenaei]|uniref:bifunctional adenosylcobinamide kinase/adenosylcobinamide-phosphate guanylyltransferase n=1 Tax=Chitinilyticum litopenaei TaxID=1121276 RepID=UPI0004043ED3|nr:bifunctional adenosylcobinamide kinase/adenosylcobinamide-phosphate guanylyltransferase [Chitinilyticum litopenaei]
MFPFPPPQGAELILGGARSGKSSHALRIARESGKSVCWIATAQAFDDEMQERIIRHRQERPPHWQTLEAPLQLAAAIADTRASCVVVDCLTLWTSNWLLSGDDAGWQVELAALQQEVARIAQGAALPDGEQRRLLLVSNEVGAGIVPDNALARAFRDRAGHVHQALARACPDVTLIQAGLPLPLKRAGRACWQ